VEHPDDLDAGAEGPVEDQVIRETGDAPQRTPAREGSLYSLGAPI